MVDNIKAEDEEELYFFTMVLYPVYLFFFVVLCSPVVR